ncbi:hypothetical protein G9A89_000440 [Geosiphon pyriformis]|nr:hypothetical protein G9A89_000440 [Geosiphon pyriformis]
MGLYLLVDDGMMGPHGYWVPEEWGEAPHGGRGPPTPPPKRVLPQPPPTIEASQVKPARANELNWMVFLLLGTCLGPVLKLTWVSPFNYTNRKVDLAADTHICYYQDIQLDQPPPPHPFKPVPIPNPFRD